MSSSSLVAPRTPVSQRGPQRRALRGWLAYAAAWVAAAGLWSLAAATSARMSPLLAVPYAAIAMGAGALAGVLVWRLTGRLPWRSPRGTFYATHAIGLVLYAAVYSMAVVIPGVAPDLARADLVSAMGGIRRSPVLWWNVLMGCWLYLMIAGLSYAIRGERARDREAAAAAEAKMLAQQAQLTALRAQLNPHFLFNALHTVSALIPHDPDGADRAIERLGELLRYAMAEDELVPLSSEWRFVLDYLAFEQLRLGDRLRVVERLDPAASGRLVPPLLLQPLVENAVRHGVAARAEGGHVHVEARVDGNTTIVRVVDDGPGEVGGDLDGADAGDREKDRDPDRSADRRADRRADGAADEGVRQGLGIASVRRRLAAVFGGRADLRIETNGPGGGYAVRLTIPEHDR